MLPKTSASGHIKLQEFDFVGASSHATFNTKMEVAIAKSSGEIGCMALIRNEQFPITTALSNRSEGSLQLNTS